MEFTVFSLADGSYVKSGSCTAPDIHMQAKDGECVIPDVRFPNGDCKLNLRTWKIEPISPSKTDDEIIVDIIRERERRLSVGIDYNFQDARGTHRIGTTPADLSGWSEVNTAALKAVARGNGDRTLFISTDTGDIIVTADEWLKVLDAVEEFRQPIWLKSFVIQGMKPLPQNVEADEHWI